MVREAWLELPNAEGGVAESCGERVPQLGSQEAQSWALCVCIGEE